MLANKGSIPATPPKCMPCSLQQRSNTRTAHLHFHDKARSPEPELRKRGVCDVSASPILSEI